MMTSAAVVFILMLATRTVASFVFGDVSHRTVYFIGFALGLILLYEVLRFLLGKVQIDESKPDILGMKAFFIPQTGFLLWTHRFLSYATFVSMLGESLVAKSLVLLPLALFPFGVHIWTYFQVRAIRRNVEARPILVEANEDDPGDEFYY
jgi:hypothetical protein